VLNSESSWVTLGRVARPRGLRGEFFLDSNIDRELPQGTAIRVTPPGANYLLRKVSHQKDRALLMLEGIDSIEAAETLRGAEIAVQREALGTEVLLSDLTGCLIIDADTGREIGKVAAAYKNPGNDLLELESGMLIPFVPAFFPTVDVEAKRLLARLPAGLDQL
jgi:16S rRNA processing protein RimM